jgi:hypothetical protein
MSLFAGVVMAVGAVIVMLGPEARGATFGRTSSSPATRSSPPVPSSLV